MGKIGFNYTLCFKRRTLTFICAYSKPCWLSFRITERPFSEVFGLFYECQATTTKQFQLQTGNLEIILANILILKVAFN